MAFLHAAVAAYPPAHRLAYWSLWLLGFMVLAVLLGPIFYKVGINDVDFKARLASALVGSRWPS